MRTSMSVSARKYDFPDDPSQVTRRILLSSALFHKNQVEAFVKPSSV